MSCCGAVRANTADTVTIDLSGTGSISNPLKGDVILDPNPSNQLVVNAGGLFAPCQPDLYADGGVPPGSLPPVLTSDFGGNPLTPNGCGPLMAPYGPQADVLITNTTNCSFALEGTVEPSQAYFTLDPGASMALGFTAQSTGLNLPPAPIVFPGILYGGINETNQGATTLCGVTADGPTHIVPFITLAPGDFIWLSVITLLYITGAGASTSVTPIIGGGPQIHLRGLRQ